MTPPPPPARTIASEWADFAAIPADDLSVAQRADLRRAFYCGALSSLQILAYTAMTPGAADTLLARLAQRLREVNDEVSTFIRRELSQALGGPQDGQEPRP